MGVLRICFNQYLENLIMKNASSCSPFLNTNQFGFPEVFPQWQIPITSEYPSCPDPALSGLEVEAHE
jgi:hypothetical protein